MATIRFEYKIRGRGDGSGLGAGLIDGSCKICDQRETSDGEGRYSSNYWGGGGTLSGVGRGCGSTSGGGQENYSGTGHGSACGGGFEWFTGHDIRTQPNLQFE